MSAIPSGIQHRPTPLAAELPDPVKPVAERDAVTAAANAVPVTPAAQERPWGTKPEDLGDGAVLDPSGVAMGTGVGAYTALAELEGRVVKPLAFKTLTDYDKATGAIYKALPEAAGDATVLYQGSSVSGWSVRRGAPFDLAAGADGAVIPKPSDLDVGLASRPMMDRAAALSAEAIEEAGSASKSPLGNFVRDGSGVRKAGPLEFVDEAAVRADPSVAFKSNGNPRSPAQIDAKVADFMKRETALRATGLDDAVDVTQRLTGREVGLSVFDSVDDAAAYGSNATAGSGLRTATHEFVTDPRWGKVVANVDEGGTIAAGKAAMNGRNALRWMGPVGTVAGLGMSAHTIATSDDKVKDTAGEVGAFAGGLAGAKIGAIGYAAGPVVGTITTIGGGVIGGLAGEKAVEAGVEFVRDNGAAVVDAVGDGLSYVGDKVGGAWDTITGWF